MKKFILKSELGFTLVELMVVVAIIGILSAIAVPNFKKYQAKAKQSEAKIQLAAVYSSEVGTSADYDNYATCLTSMGYETEPRGYYLIGFATAIAMPGAVLATCTATDSPILVPGNQLAAVTANKPTVVANLVASTAAQNVFTAAASGSISVAVTLDQWSITEKKLITNNTPGF